MARLNVIGISGSLRKGSFNTHILHAAKALSSESLTMTIYDLSDVPLFNGDLEKGGDPESIVSFKNAIENSDGLFIVTPEYHEGIPGVLKNALDWAGSDANRNVLTHLQCGVIGSSPNMLGTAYAQKQVKQTLTAAGASVMQKPDVYIAEVHRKLSQGGQLKDERTSKFIESYLIAFEKWLRHKI